MLRTSGWYTVVSAKPAPNHQTNFGPVNSISNLPGILFPFFRELPQPDRVFLHSTILKYFLSEDVKLTFLCLHKSSEIWWDSKERESEEGRILLVGRYFHYMRQTTGTWAGAWLWQESTSRVGIYIRGRLWTDAFFSSFLPYIFQCLTMSLKRAFSEIADSDEEPFSSPYSSTSELSRPPPLLRRRQCQCGLLLPTQYGGNTPNNTHVSWNSSKSENKFILLPFLKEYCHMVMIRILEGFPSWLRAALLCTWNRDLEKYAVAFHFSHVTGPDREVAIRDAFQKCSKNVHNWRSRGFTNL